MEAVKFNYTYQINDEKIMELSRELSDYLYTGLEVYKQILLNKENMQADEGLQLITSGTLKFISKVLFDTSECLKDKFRAPYLNDCQQILNAYIEDYLSIQKSNKH